MSPTSYKEPFTYSVPEESEWACWRDGGCTVYASEQTSPKEPDPTTGQLEAWPVPYEAVGMQELYDVVRQEAPDNVVLIGGLDWAYDLSGVGAGYGISGTNIVYDTHVYTQWHNTSADWDAHFEYLTKTHPVSATEFGSIDCSADVTRQLIEYFDAPMGNAQNRMSWTIWSWSSPGECSQPSLLANREGAPLPDQGRLVYESFQRYAEVPAG